MFNTRYTPFKRRCVQFLPCVIVLLLFVPNVAHASLTKVLAETVGNLILKIAAWFAWLGGFALDYSTNELVLNMGRLITQDTGMGQTINETWTIIRDVCNLAFVFGFVYIGVRTILQNEGSDYKRFLARLIIAAILINFSLFITKAVIDISNYITIEVYETLRPFDTNTGNPVNIGEAFANRMGITELVRIRDIDASAFQKLDPGGVFVFYLGASAFLGVAAYVFLSGALLLIFRFVALVIIMVFSPILFAGTVFSETSKYSKQLWSLLVGYAFFAPVYYFMLLITLRIIEGGAQSIGGNEFVRALIDSRNNDVSVFGAVIKFVVIIGFMLISLRVAKDMSKYGGDRATGWAKKATLWGAKKTGGVLTFAPRMIGRGAKAGAQVGVRNAVGASSKWALKKFDDAQARNPKLFNRFGLDRELRGALERGQTAKFGRKYSFKDNEEYEKDRTRRTTQRAAELERAKRFKTADTAIGEAATSAEDFAKAAEELGKVVREMSVDEKVELGMSNKGGLTDQRIATNLKDSDIEALEKSGKFSLAQINEIKEARKQGFNSIAKNGDVQVRNAAGNLVTGRGMLVRGFAQKQRQALVDRGPQDVGKLDHAVLADANMRQYLTPQIVEARMRNGGDMTPIRDSLDEYLKTAPDNVRKVWRNWTERSTAGASLGLTIP